MCSGAATNAASMRVLRQDLADCHIPRTGNYFWITFADEITISFDSGASRGIGRAIAVNLASRGVSILGTCSSTASLHRIESLSSEIRDMYRESGYKAPKVVGIAADIFSFESPALIVETLQNAFGGKLHILVNNAAYDETRPMGSLDDDYVLKVLTGNTHSLVMTVDVLFRNGCIQPDSRIINISSVSGRKIPYPAMYLVGATKATMEALTRSWATLLGNDPVTLGTTVNALLVGATATDALLREAPVEMKQMMMEVLKSKKPVLGAMGRAQDVADVAGLLASEEARWVTESVICANGGDYHVM